MTDATTDTDTATPKVREPVITEKELRLPGLLDHIEREELVVTVWKYKTVPVVRFTVINGTDRCVFDGACEFDQTEIEVPVSSIAPLISALINVSERAEREATEPKEPA